MNGWRSVSCSPVGTQRARAASSRAWSKNWELPRPFCSPSPARARDYCSRCSLQPLTTSNYFAAGHSLRIEVSSSNFPRFDRNLNTGNPIGDDDQPRIATNRIYHDADHPSHILLPVIPG